MVFGKALEAMKIGYKVKLPSWSGYWYWDAEKETVMMHTKDGEEIDIRDTKQVEYTLKNIARDDWEMVIHYCCKELAISHIMKKAEKLIVNYSDSEKADEVRNTYNELYNFIKDLAWRAIYNE